jgi:hypothetical protein
MKDPIVISYLNPKARCPVCGSAVLFYRSPYDGRVFFDTGAPNWDRHGCTRRSASDRALDDMDAVINSRKARAQAARGRDQSDARPPKILSPHSLDEIVVAECLVSIQT